MRKIPYVGVYCGIQFPLKVFTNTWQRKIMNGDHLERLEVMSWEVCPLGLIVPGSLPLSPLPEHPPFSVLVLHD